MIPRKIVIIGPGAVGTCVGAWLAEAGLDVSIHGRPQAMDLIEERGLRHYEGSMGPATASLVRPKILRSLELLEKDDILVFCTKNRGLEEAASVASAASAARPFALSLANGFDNQAILPRYFSRRAYGIVGFNCWLDETGLAGWQSRGPLVIGSPEDGRMEECRALGALFSTAFPVETTRHFDDAAHSKLVINLANTVTSLVGQGFRPLDDVASLQRLLSRTLAEGVRVVKAAGYRGYKVGEMPGFGLISVLDVLPGFLTRGIFSRNLAKMVKSSMSQDLFQRGRHDTELESLTGYLVHLAHRVGVSAPWNESLYRIAKERFSEPEFKPLEPAELLAMIEDVQNL